MMRKGEVHTAPVTGILLKDVAEGQIVKVNENGFPVEFYVAKHDYESALNGIGRTLLVRKETIGAFVWNSNGKSTYADSDINKKLNETYYNKFSDNCKSLIDTTKFYYTIGNGDKTIATLSRHIFLLSVNENGGDNISSGNFNIEGQTLPIYALLYSAVQFWTRTPDIRTDFASYAYFMQANGGWNASPTINNKQVRPCFTLPSNALFDKTTMLLKGVK